jgi:hypothetical protein
VLHNASLTPATQTYKDAKDAKGSKNGKQIATQDQQGNCIKLFFVALCFLFFLRVLGVLGGEKLFSA